MLGPQLARPPLEIALALLLLALVLRLLRLPLALLLLARALARVVPRLQELLLLLLLQALFVELDTLELARDSASVFQDKRTSSSGVSMRGYEGGPSSCLRGSTTAVRLRTQYTPLAPRPRCPSSATSSRRPRAS